VAISAQYYSLKNIRLQVRNARITIEYRLALAKPDGKSVKLGKIRYTESMGSSLGSHR